ncbi:uncharacterized protein LOC107419736 [Ziziphus jujuba]|uniref:Uncharacterized protein LOC107419736 n=1 Tax=Ziziphus jujuba TaxID=326968 RepID=A0A6P3ZVR7_ZIZJJ|nr:uncharacterized protein LOC107419736 [Ziziphus jujuba]
MDSLLANYASSDDEEVEEQQRPAKRTALESDSGPGNSTAHSTSSLFSSLPQRKSSSLFQSLPLPKQSLPNPLASKPKPVLDDDEDGEEPYSKPSSRSSETAPKSSSSSSSLFSKLPQPKSQFPQQQPSPILSTSEPNTKRVIQFKPPVVTLKSSELDDDDDEDDREKEKKNETDPLQTKSVASFLSSIPAPKNSSTLGVLPSSGSGRRAIVVETQVSASNSGGSAAENDREIDQNSGSLANYNNPANHGQVDSYGDYQNAVQDASFVDYGNYHSNFDQNVNVGVSGQMGSEIGVADGSGYGNYEGYGSYVDYGQYTNSVADGSEVSIMCESELRVNGKRGRDKIPTEIVEVKQDELMKNRPREDQAKLTGIAFGPAYQPASTKGKPSKLHKRKHQIGSLYFDMKQKETELAERRSRGFLTKAETQAKYGW